MSSERLWDAYEKLLLESTELTERLRVACETIEQLKRVNKEWETLWKPIDDLVRPSTPLGGSVGDKAVELLKWHINRVNDYNSALRVYDGLSEDDKVSFKEYVFQTWPHLNPEVISND